MYSFEQEKTRRTVISNDSQKVEAMGLFAMFNHSSRRGKSLIRQEILDDKLLRIVLNIIPSFRIWPDVQLITAGLTALIARMKNVVLDRRALLFALAVPHAPSMGEIRHA